MLPKLSSTLCLFRCLCPTSAPAFRRLQSTQIPNPQRIAEHTKRIAELESKLDIYNKEDKTRAYERGKLEQQHLNNLNLQSAIEIISEVFWQKASLRAPKLLLASRVQPILDAIVGGSFDDHVKYADAQAAVVAAVASQGGISVKAITQSLSKLYMELSKNHHSGVSDTIEICENEQTMAEAIAAMSILLYARRLYGSPLDAVLRDEDGISKCFESHPLSAFDGNPQLTHDLLDEHACCTSATQLVVRISAGLIHMDLEVLHNPPGQPATVGDVLTHLHRYLRERERDLPPVTMPYTNRRAETVNGSKRVDHLLGHTLFAGLFVRLGKPENFWQLDLAIPQRYAT
ncbi:hypothetical protein B0H10DRAFT_1945645 [Mycena sp. CBHHK59/15]|nr:hypothetical protein B0H10DRAFT_1945645 [Mycena sp. CBHHK59/15]